MMANPFERAFNEPLPSCCSQGDCCKGASPSTPFYLLWEKAARGDEFARGFFSIMEPYPSHDAARREVPGLVERTLAASKKSDSFRSEADVVFYRCRYLLENNRCGVHEDRPQFCRDYPDTPFVVMAPGCAFESWAARCKSKYEGLKEELTELKSLKAELESIRTQTQTLLSDAPSSPRSQSKSDQSRDETDLPWSVDQTRDMSLLLSLTQLYIGSPLGTMWLLAV